MEEPHKPKELPQNLSGTYRDARHHKPVLTWNYSVKGVLRRAEASLLFGPSNCGKSAMVCHLGHCIVTGREFFGAPVKKGIVVHVGAEAPDSVLDRMQALGLQDDEAAAPYIVRMTPVDLSQPCEVDDFVNDLRKVHQETGEKIILIVFDTLARSIGETDENCAGAMTDIANTAQNIAQALKAHVMLVHHTGKDAERGSRGSSALRGAIDTEISLTPLKSGAVAVAQEKQRTMPKSGPVYFRTESYVLGLDEDGEDRTTVKAVEVAEPPKSEKNRNRCGNDAGIDLAVHTALHVRRMTVKHALEPFRPRDVLETLPPELFCEINEESRIRSVSRSLGKLARREKPIVEQVKNGWQFVGSARTVADNT